MIWRAVQRVFSLVPGQERAPVDLAFNWVECQTPKCGGGGLCAGDVRMSERGSRRRVLSVRAAEQRALCT